MAKAQQRGGGDAMIIIAPLLETPGLSGGPKLVPAFRKAGKVEQVYHKYEQTSEPGVSDRMGSSSRPVVNHRAQSERTLKRPPVSPAGLP
jgi:hypothetical protein